ncbi:CBS domain-containing protein [Leeia sp. TBRC 13508]|uniref:CBS domain-containing protein n=1 Tax=Leeia speluncae TaxID=2884804 RepID=A0ABS8D975_9NEIS|nr:CBS domain-containing protein [Leeia speluncae]MCB6184735.1 CBS domain-containing protein [Leeia speluncae]
MKLAQHILDSKPAGIYSVPPHASIYSVLQLMAEKDIGAVLVMEEESLVGIFSERDYARKIILKGKNSTDTLVSDVMTSRLIVVQPKTDIHTCMALMSKNRIRHLPVVENNTVIGVLSITDLVKAVIAEQEFVIAQLEQYIHQ